METAPALVPAPAVVADRSKPVIIRPPEVTSAHDFAVIGWILTLLLSVPWIVLSLLIGGIGVAAYLGYVILPVTMPSVPVLNVWLAFFAFVLANDFRIYMGIGAAGLLVAIIFLGWIYFGIVRNINKGRYEKARNASLFFGVLFILPTFFVLVNALLGGLALAIIPAFFFLLTYGRLGEVIAKYGPVAVLGEAMPGSPFAAPPGAPVGPGGPVAVGLGPPIAGPPPAGAVMPPGPGPGMPFQPLTGVAPRVPLCPGCGRELYYSQNHRRWYCMTCDNPTGTGSLPHPS
jgi:hypothetical protein